MTERRPPGPHRGREVRISRLFRAPRELVFSAWIDPDQVAAWMAPAHCDVPRETVDVQPHTGGRIHFTQIDRESGAAYPVRFDILELTTPDLLVLSSPPEPRLGLPYPMLTRVEFEAEDGGTRVTITQGPHTEDLQPEATRGWRESLDKLERLVARDPAPDIRRPDGG